MSEIQEPMTAHPAYADIHAALLPYLTRDYPHFAVQIPGPSTPAWASYGGEHEEVMSVEQFPVRTLQIKRAVGPAPFTGEPFDYRWNVAVDDLGRQIAGESWIEPWSYERVLEWEWNLRTR